MSTRRSPGSRRWARRLFALAGALAALAILYLLVANAVLVWKLRSAAARAGVVVGHVSAYTLYPGQVQIDGLHLADPGGGWRVALDRTDVALRPASLLFGRVEVTRVASRVRAAEGERLQLIEGPAPVGAVSDGDHWAVRVPGARVRVRAAGVALTGELGADLRLYSPDPASGRAEIEGGTLEARGVVAEASARAPMDGRVEVHAGSLSLRGGATFAGKVHVRGGDAGALLDLAGLAGAARWALVGLEGRPFTIDAAVRRAPDAVVLEDVRVESGAVRVRGGLVRRGGASEGAFLVRSGGLVTGVALAGGRAELVLPADEEWLARRLAAMAGPGLSPRVR